MEATSGKFDVVIVGGGAAGIGLSASLKRRDSRLSIAIIEPSALHSYQPSWTLVGGGAFDVKDSRRATRDVIPEGVVWIEAAAETFDPDNNTVTTSDGRKLAYDYLAVAPGLVIKWDAIAGLKETIGRNGVTSNYSYDYAPYTWELAQTLSSGKAIFTQPPMPIKCPGAPQKAMYLSCSEWLRRGVLKNMSVEMDNAGAALFGVAPFVPPLMEYVQKYGIDLVFNSNLVEVDGETRRAWFDGKDADGNVSRVEKSFDMLHVVPPQGPVPAIKASPLANADGWVEVDQFTLQHVKYPNVFGLGDGCSTPNSKTAAAARKQIVVVAENLVALKAGKSLEEKYDGYGSCPLTVERGKIVLAEFGYGGKVMPTFPSWINDPFKATWLAWVLKKDMLPWIYWNGMLKGREWLAKSVSN